MSRKVFTAGEVLAAADVNSFLMDQTVMSFAGTAARGSAIPSPVEGMVTYLEDIDDLRTYNGSSWVSPYAMTLIANVPFTAASIVTADNVFTSAYLNYRVVFQAVKVATAATPAIRMRSGGSPLTANYEYQGYRSNSTNVSAINGRNVAQWVPGVGVSPGDQIFIDIRLFNPATADLTGIIYEGFSFESPSFFGYHAGGQRRASTVEDGIQLEASGTMTGTLKIYGLRNA
jgi:hypothetical protein